MENYSEILACPVCKSKVLSDGKKVICSEEDCGMDFGIKDGLPVMFPRSKNEEPLSHLEKVLNDPKAVMFKSNFMGIPLFKIDFVIKKYLYNFFHVTLPKLKDQRDYWLKRGKDYMDDFIDNGYEDLEIFFQDMLIEELKVIEFDSFFEAGCGFGWNINRVKKEFPEKMVGGLDFSHAQLLNGKKRFLKEDDFVLVEGDATKMPFVDNAFDVGFSLGVFMNIHQDKIGSAIDEMVRVSKKYIIHLEYDEGNTTPELKAKRAFKTNIISHDYKKMYEDRGLKIKVFKTYRDFGKEYDMFKSGRSENVNRWENWEGPGKYIFLVAEKM